MNYLYAYVRLVWKTLNGRFNKLKFYFTFLILFIRELRFCVSKPLKDEFFVQHSWKLFLYITFQNENSLSWPDFISFTPGSCGHLEKIPTENNENFTKKCGISKIICDIASRAIYLNTRLQLRLKGWLI